MYTIGMVIYSEHDLKDLAELEQALTQQNYPVYIEQMGVRLQEAKIGEYFYEENAILLWLCRCYSNQDRCREAVKQYLEQKVDILLAVNPLALATMLEIAGQANIPIVFTRTPKSLYAQLRAAYPQVVCPVTGVFDTQMELVEERAALLAEVIPMPQVIHTVYNPESPESLAELGRLSQACQSLSIELDSQAAHNSVEVKELLGQLKTGSNHALFRLSDPLVDPVTGLMGAVAREHYIPYIGCRLSEMANSGALFALEYKDTYRQAVSIFTGLIQGNGPAAISIREPGEVALGVNLQAMQDLHLIISPALLQKAQLSLSAKGRSSFRSRLLGLLVAVSLGFSILAVAASYLGVLALFGVTLVAAVLVSTTIWIFISRRIVNPLNQLTLAAERIGVGDLNTPIREFAAEDEVGALARALRRTKSNLRDSYSDLEQMAHNLEARIEEMAEANRLLRHTQHELEIAGRRIIDAEDNSRFALTTYIHDEILGPLDDLYAQAMELGDANTLKLVQELENRVRRLRFDLSAPILYDLDLELRRLIQETLPLIYPNARTVALNLDLAGLRELHQLEPACMFLLYRFVRGAVSNVYRHAKASRVSVKASYSENKLSVMVVDNGCGFDPAAMDQYVMNGHYFFHDIHIRARQLKGDFRIETHPQGNTLLEVTVPVKAAGKNSPRESTHRQGSKLR